MWSMDCSPPGSCVRVVLQARILEGVVMPFSKGSSWPRDQTCMSCIAGGFFTIEPPWKPRVRVRGDADKGPNKNYSYSFYYLYLISEVLHAILAFHFISLGKFHIAQYCPNFRMIQFSSFQSLSCVQLFATPWIAACQASLSITNSWSSLRLTSIGSVMPSSHLILCCPLLLLPQSLPASKSFPMSQLFKLGGQSTGVSASASFLPKKSQGWSPSEWTGWMSLQSKGLSRVFSKTIVQKHQFFNAQPSSQSNSHIHTWPLEKP